MRNYVQVVGNITRDIEHKLINGRLAIVSILFLLIIGWGIYGIMNLELVGELYGI